MPISICWITYRLIIWPLYLSPLRNIPGPPSENILLGNFQRFIKEGAGDTHLRWVKKYGNLVKFYGLFNTPTIIVTDAKLIQDILLSNGYDFCKPKLVRGDVDSIIGVGLAFVEGNAHKRQRKMMNPAFTHFKIKNMVPTFSNVALKLISLLEDKLDKGESKINLSPYISKATLDVIGLVGFNYEFNSLTSQSELAEAYEIFSTDLTLLGNIAVYLPLIRKIPIEINKKFNNASRVIERESSKLMEEKYKDYKNNKLNGHDLLSILINLNKTLPIEEKLTDVELKYQIMTFLFAGHETTSNSTSWALYLLAQHPNIQDLLREELVKAFPDKSKFNPTFEEINSLEYLNCQFFIIVIAIRRANINDKMLGDIFIPKNTLIDIPIATLHRLPSIWGPTVDDFDPKRWSNPSLTENVTNYNYMPFGAGIRSCIGNKLALSEFKILLSMFVRNFTFQSIEGFHINKKAGFLLKPNPYVELNVSRVEF
ncbi:576_t:CDS:2 [Funneliformis geosporum]|nr:576_t:CDS:2 [Funneliformis geosporum]